MKAIFIVVLVLIVLSPLAIYSMKRQLKSGSPFKTVDAKDFSKLLESPKVFLLDVRTQEEFDAGHLQNAVLIDFNSVDYVDKIKKIFIESNKEIIAIYCRSGRRSAMAAEQISKEGIQLVNLKGGILDWMEKGFPTVK